MKDQLKDFRNFLFVIWDHLGLPNPSDVQYDIANYLQDGPQRRIIQAFRGCGKSWITVAYVLWRLYLDPKINIEVISASGRAADDFSTFCFQLINDIEILRHLRPHGDQRSSKVQFDVGPAGISKDPSVKSVGITGQITGTRADIIIADDIEISTNCDTQTARDKLEYKVKEFTSILKPGGEIIYLGTPHTEDSLYSKLTERTGFTTQIWPLLVPTEKERLFYGEKLAPSIDKMYTNELNRGESVWPERFSDEEVNKRQLEGKTNFQMQQMLNPLLADEDRYPLKLSDLVVMDVDPARAPEEIVWASDPDLAWGNDIPNVGFSGDRMYRPMKCVGDWLTYEGIVMAIDPSGRG